MIEALDDILSKVGSKIPNYFCLSTYVTVVIIGIPTVVRRNRRLLDPVWPWSWPGATDAYRRHWRDQCGSGRSIAEQNASARLTPVQSACVRHARMHGRPWWYRV